jgi:DNA-binding NarL/FixJ family response regulator
MSDPVTSPPTRVLLADDEPSMLAALQGLLDAAGYDVVGAAGNGISAVEEAVRLRPDLVLADLRMPGLSGIEVAVALRKSAPDIPVVVLSAYDDVAIQVAAERSPVVAFLVKGCSSWEIFQTIDNWTRGAVPQTTRP